ncbi:hypothetical protein DICPUDRAFT_83022 [Dictyostelium purpureum]|uniref:Uncharacterized protein n=1 Tax=Dictyostelium purpureum TaxID=5786 RepID=F0ZYB2_DICPU|nr:uncharacterized protein DICPUDRAFT_83022 [Dictyostelium purpureum]EGC31076.1 hypothetical protein DICPUDRAFT_83022 [Dictyostelium purpureum]|eukprot:XP_003292402.1 hypothetical protein DICPUDRAFT_83022 [Dictyostelium purpureum]
MENNNNDKNNNSNNNNYNKKKRKKNKQKHSHLNSNTNSTNNSTNGNNNNNNNNTNTNNNYCNKKKNLNNNNFTQNFKYIDTPPLVSVSLLNTTGKEIHNKNDSGRKTPPLLMLNSNSSIPSLNDNTSSAVTSNKANTTTTTTTTTTSTSTSINSIQPPPKIREYPGYYYDVEKDRYFKITKEFQKILTEKKKKEKEQSEIPIKLNQSNSTANEKKKKNNITDLLKIREINTKSNGFYNDNIKNIMVKDHLKQYVNIPCSSSISNISLFGDYNINQIVNNNNSNKINNNDNNKSIITKGIVSSSNTFLNIDWLNTFYNQPLNNENNIDNNDGDRLNTFFSNEKLNYEQEYKISKHHSLSIDLYSNITSIRVNKNVPNLLSVTTLGDHQREGSVNIFRVDSLVYDVIPLDNLFLSRSSIWCSQWCPTNDNIVSIGGSSGKLLIYDLNCHKNYYQVLSKSDILAQDFNRNGTTIFNGSRDGFIRMVDIRTKTAPNSNNQTIINLNIQKDRINHSSSISSINSLLDDNYLIVSSLNGSISKWDRRINKKVLDYPFNCNSHLKLGISLTPDEQFLGAAGEDKFVRIWNTSTGVLIKTIGPLEKAATGLEFIDYFDSSKNNDHFNSLNVNNSNGNNNSNNGNGYSSTKLNPIFYPTLFLIIIIIFPFIHFFNK